MKGAKSPRTVKNIPRPRRKKKLPTVLSKDEVLRLLSFVKNLKHKAIIMLVYSVGLRVKDTKVLKRRKYIPM
ncbi:MAG TPA: hypothetical protein EYP60_06510 [bacterium (Candidatus Stahlbacteria)]|nr:hypothetical protein [Candidatus Stahlbacteria bacterium]